MESLCGPQPTIQTTMVYSIARQRQAEDADRLANTFQNAFRQPNNGKDQLKAPKYDGSEDVEVVIRQFTDVVQANNWNQLKALFLKSHYLLGKLSMMTSLSRQYFSTVLNLECKHPSNTWPKHEGGLLLETSTTIMNENKIPHSTNCDYEGFSTTLLTSDDQPN